MGMLCFLWHSGRAFSDPNCHYTPQIFFRFSAASLYARSAFAIRFHANEARLLRVINVTHLLDGARFKIPRAK